MKDIETVAIVNTLPVKLTRDELLSKGRELAETERTLARLKTDRKEYLEGYADRIESAETIRGRLVNQIESETEQRAVDCTLEKDYLSFKVRTIRNDTGAVVGERAMDESERQRTLPENMS